MQFIHTSAAALLSVLVLGCASRAERTLAPERLAQRLRDPDPAQQLAAARDAWQAGPPAVAAVVPLLASEQPSVAKHAGEALATIVHHAAAPDAGGERGALAAELVRLLDTPLPAHVRCTLLELLGSTAEDAYTLRAISARLADPQLADAALFALTRADCAASTRELAKALSRDGLAVSRADLARALAGREARPALDGLLELARRGTPEEARAARAALARSADGRVKRVLTGALAAGEPGAARDVLRHAERLAETGARAEAQPLYEGLLGAAQPAHERAAALSGLAHVGGDAQLERLMAALGDEASDVRAVAREALTDLESSEAARGLAREYGSDPSAARRAELLRVIVARRDPGAEALLLSAVDAAQPELRLAALELARERPDPALEAALCRSVLAGAADEREVAARSLLVHAGVHQRAGESQRALDLYHLLLEVPVQTAVAATALDGVTALARPESLERVRALADQPALAEAAGRARVAIAAALPASARETAVRELEHVVAGGAGRAVRTSAAQKLAEFGVDTSKFARARGFLTRWYLCGTFPPATGTELGTQPFGETGPQAPAGEPASFTASGAPERGWTRHVSSDLDGVVDLTRCFETHDNVCAYALARLTVPVATAAVLKLGSDDGVAVWLDGQLVHSNDAYRGLSVDSDRVELPLGAGVHHLLLKINQGGGGWEFCARLCDAEGEPLDFTSP